MENQQAKRLDGAEIRIVDAIRFTVTLLLAFLTDREKAATQKD
jgi:hypothetical protein